MLRAATGTGVVLAAGCLGSDDEHATLQRLYLLNDLDEPVTTELRIERTDTDEVVHEEGYDLPAGFDGVVVDCVWPDAPLRVLTRREGNDEWTDYTTAGGDGCVALLSETHEHGTSFFDSREECPIRSPTCHEDVGQ